MIVIGCFGELETLKINDLDIFKDRSVHWALLSNTVIEIKDTITLLELFEKADQTLSLVDFSRSFLSNVITSEECRFPCYVTPKLISTTDILMYADRFNIPVPERLRPDFFGKINMNELRAENIIEEIEWLTNIGEFTCIEETSGVPLFLFSASLAAGIANDGNVLGHKLKNPQKKIQFFVMEELLHHMSKKIGNTPNNSCYYKVPCKGNDMYAFIMTAINKENASIVVFDSIFVKNNSEALRSLLAVLRRRKTTVFIILNQSLSGEEEIPDYLRILIDKHIRLLPHESKKNRLMLEIFDNENEIRREVIEKLDNGWKLIETPSAEELATFKNLTQTVEKNTSEEKYSL